MTTKAFIQEFGWAAVPRNRSNVPSKQDAKGHSIQIDFDAWPTSDVVKKAQEFVKAELPEETFNHSMRVFHYGTLASRHQPKNDFVDTDTGHTMVTQHFPSWISSSPSAFFETWAVTCLFHDIATTESNRNATHLSFEFQGGFIALEQLQRFGAPREQAESVCEAIIRHQDPGDTGTISRMGQLVQMATEFGSLPLPLFHSRKLQEIRTLIKLFKKQTTWAGNPTSSQKTSSSK